MTTDTKAPPVAVTVDRSDPAKPVLAVVITDGEGDAAVLRYPLPTEEPVRFVRNDEREVGTFGAIRVCLSAYSNSINLPGSIILVVNGSVAKEVAEAMAGPIPDAPHACSVAGCTHGH